MKEKVNMHSIRVWHRKYNNNEKWPKFTLLQWPFIFTIMLGVDPLVFFT